MVNILRHPLGDGGAVVGKKPSNYAPYSKDQNLSGWDSIAPKWDHVGWPRRPKWGGEFEKVANVINSAKGRQVGIFGSTPEFRNWAPNTDTRTFLFEKSVKSYSIMTSILKKQFHKIPKNEVHVKSDWENLDYENKSFKLLMGDIFTGYLQTPERLCKFLEDAYRMLEDKGKFIIRDFTNTQFKGEIRHIPLTRDEKRWAYVLKNGFAIEGDTFFEGKLADNLLKIGDVKVFQTCAAPPRVRLILPTKEFEKLLNSNGFKAETVIAPSASEKPTPGLWVLGKN